MYGPLGRFYLRPLVGRRPGGRWVRHPRAGGPWFGVAAAVVVVLAALWWFAAGAPLLDALTRTGRDPGGGAAAPAVTAAGTIGDGSRPAVLHCLLGPGGGHG